MKHIAPSLKATFISSSPWPLRRQPGRAMIASVSRSSCQIVRRLPPRHDPNGLCAGNLWFGEARDENDQLALAVRLRLLVDGLELVAGGEVGDAKALGRGLQRLLAEQAVGEPRLGRREAEDAHELGGDGGRPRGEVDENDEASSQREALADR